MHLRPGAIALSLIVLLSGAPRSADIAFEHVTVIDVESGARLRDQTVVVSGTRIVSVRSGRSAIPAIARTIDGRGAFLIPGLWDMHAHALDAEPGTLALFVANGITGVRDMGGRLDTVMAAVARIRSGEVVSPRAVVAGTIIDGAPAVHPEVSVVAHTPAEGRAWVDSLATRGVDFIKAYELLRPDVAAAIVDEAKARRLPVVGHVPVSMDATAVSNLGYHSLEHLRNVDAACSNVADSLRVAAIEELRSAENTARSGAAIRSAILEGREQRVYASFDAERCDAVLRLFKRNGTWQIPTFAIGDAYVLRTDTMQHVRDYLPFVSAATREDWGRASRAWGGGRASLAKLLGSGSAAADSIAKHGARAHLIFRRMVELGVPVLAGTDYGNPWVAPGFSLHDELATFVRDGMSPLDALRSATLSPARFLNATDSLGTIAAGKLADLVLLDGDPLLDIANTRRIRMVVVNGRLFDRRAIDSLLLDARAANRAPSPH